MGHLLLSMWQFCLIKKASPTRVVVLARSRGVQVFSVTQLLLQEVPFVSSTSDRLALVKMRLKKSCRECCAIVHAMKSVCDCGHCFVFSSSLTHVLCQV